jgi:hypothetical protein
LVEEVMLPKANLNPQMMVRAVVRAVVQVVLVAAEVVRQTRFPKVV